MKTYKLIMGKNEKEWFNFYHSISQIYNAICSLKTLGYSLKSIKIIYPNCPQNQIFGLVTDKKGHILMPFMKGGV